MPRVLRRLHETCIPMRADRIKDLFSELEDMVAHDFENLQDWDTLYAWPVGESRRIGDTINTKVYQSATEMRFITIILPGGQFDKHWHDIAETCRVIAGILKDLLSGMVWGRDEVAVFSRGQKHIPANPDQLLPTWLEVKFHK